jgi:hypothetical protein
MDVVQQAQIDSSVTPEVDLEREHSEQSTMRIVLDSEYQLAPGTSGPPSGPDSNALSVRPEAQRLKYRVAAGCSKLHN